MASVEEVQKFYKSKRKTDIVAVTTHTHATRHHATKRSFEQFLGGGDFARLKCHEAKELDKRGADGVHAGLHSLESGLVDKTQSSARARVTDHMPSLQRKSAPWSFSMGRELIPKEALLVLGVPTYEDAIPVRFRSVYVCPYIHLLQSTQSESQEERGVRKFTLPDGVVRSMAGNAKSVPIAGIAFAVCMSHIQRRVNIELELEMKCQPDDEEDIE